MLVGPQLILRWTESTAQALESLGCRVQVAFYNQSGLRQGIKGLRRLAFKWGGFTLPAIPQPILYRYGSWQVARFGRVLVEEAAAFRPDLILILKGESLRANLLRQFKELTGATIAVWWVDHPFMNVETQRPWAEVPASVPLYDACFIFDRSYEADLRAVGARHVHLLPCAADSNLFRPLQLTDIERTIYGTAVSLIGVYTESRANVVKAFRGMPGLGIWGPRWKGFLAGDKRSLDAFRAEELQPSDACKVYNSSQVNLNTHHQQSRAGGLNTRAFEIPAAGGFELTDHVAGMEALLEPGREVAVYQSPEEAVDLARYYMKAEDQRRHIAEAGHKRVLAEHTYRHRMETLLDVVA